MTLTSTYREARLRAAQWQAMRESEKATNEQMTSSSMTLRRKHKSPAMESGRPNESYMTPAGKG